MPDKALASIHEAAKYAAVNPRTIRRRIADGSLTGYRLGARVLLVDLNELDALLRPIPTDNVEDLSDLDRDSTEAWEAAEKAEAERDRLAAVVAEVERLVSAAEHASWTLCRTADLRAVLRGQG
jgi:excisionase family DNA binding protein